MLDQARAAAADDNLTVAFEVADLFALPFADDSFDVVHAHQVLQHVAEPVAALVEMRRVCRPGGLVAARDGDYPSFTFAPAEPDLSRAIAAYGELTRVNRAHWDAARHLLAWAHAAGFEDVTATASVWCFATPQDRDWWGGLWADRFTAPGSFLAAQLESHGIADRDRWSRSGRHGGGGRPHPTGGSPCCTARCWPSPDVPPPASGTPASRPCGQSPPDSAATNRNGSSTIG